MKVSRRDLLKMISSLSATVPVAGLAQIIVNGMVQKAMGATDPSGYRYIYFNQPGAPPRWTFDLFLNPYAPDSDIVANAGVGTIGKAVGGRYTEIAYKTISRQGINVPPVWGARVPAPGGGTRALSGLLGNLLSIRGVNVGAPGHAAAQRLSFQPIGAEWTVTGLVAESGQGFPLKAIDVSSGGYMFNSRQALSATRLPQSLGARTGPALFNPFLSQASASFKGLKAQAAQELAAAASALDAYAAGQHAGAAILKGAQGDADKIMSGAVQTLLDKWDDVYNKYAKLVTSAIMSTEIQGVTDKPWGATQRPTGAARELYLFDAGVFANQPVDLRQVFDNQVLVRGLAEAFALAELALTENLTNCLSCPIGPLMNLGINGGRDDHNNDQHSTGAFVGVLLNTKRAAAIGACMLELVEKLKQANIFNRTVIQLGSEFNRSPRSTGAGSDHGEQAGSWTFISGMVDGPKVIGNVRKNAPSAVYKGSWGYGANSIANRQLDPGDVANALAVMLRLPQVVRRNEQIIGLSGGKVVSKIGNGRQV